jgi:hypothetical protein
LLAAVVLHTLVSEGREGLTVRRVALTCERDPDDPADLDEIEAALAILLADSLAECEARREDGGQGEDGLFLPTRAAIRADELSF